MVAVDLLMQCYPVDSQYLGGAGDIPLVSFQYILNMVLFHVDQGKGLLPECRKWLEEFEIIGVQRSSFGKHNGAFNGVFKFSHVARPIVLHQKPGGLRRQMIHVLGGFVAELVQKMACQKWDISFLSRNGGISRRITLMR